MDDPTRDYMNSRRRGKESRITRYGGGSAGRADTGKAAREAMKADSEIWGDDYHWSYESGRSMDNEEVKHKNDPVSRRYGHYTD